MRFEWDEAKNITNYQKHGILFPLAQEIFASDVVRLVDNRKDYGESRIIAIGRVEEVHLTVAYTERNNAIRIISARKANKKERILYEKTYA